MIDSSQIAALRKYGINEEYRARTRTFSSLDTFATTTAKCSCSGKDTINKDGELQRLREMLDTVRSRRNGGGKVTRRAGLSGAGIPGKGSNRPLWPGYDSSDLTSHLGWVRCWFSPLLRVFSLVSSLQKTHKIRNH